MREFDFTGNGSEVEYLEPRARFDSYILGVEEGVTRYDKFAVVGAAYRSFLEELKGLEAIAGREYSEYGESVEDRARSMAVEWFESQARRKFIFEHVKE